MTTGAVFNHGKHRRDFTYVDDIVEGVVRALDRPAQANPAWNSLHPDPGSSSAPWRVYNIGNNHPVSLDDFVAAIEKALGKRARLELMPLQAGDVPDTAADIEGLKSELNYQPRIQIDEGVGRFVDWYRHYFGN